jgi:phage terminase small subunit
VRDLSNKQKRFIQEYLIDLNATQAAIRAGYKKNYADRMGHKLVENSRVKEAIQKAMDERSKRTEITADMVIQELAKLGFSNMRTFTKWGPRGVTLLDSDELTEDDAACVSEVSETVTESGGSVRFKLHDKKGALELLGKHLKLFTDKVEHSGKIEYGIKLPGDLDDTD